MRKSGVLLHISSLPSRHGIGKLGQSAYQFVDFLSGAGISCWQVLPLSPTGYGDSPYQSCSTRAGNPYLIDFEQLAEQGLLTPADYDAVNWGESPDRVDYRALYENCLPVLRTAFSALPKRRSTAFRTFLSENADWIDDYALFSALKEKFGGRPWYEWERPLAMRDPSALKQAKTELKTELEFYRFLQFCFFTQWHNLKTYANSKGISLIGDMPIYVAYDSVEVWVSPELFELDQEKRPIRVAGCPPDAFSETGQLWGNPLYNWETHKADGYRWWIQRLQFLSNLFDCIRIDHFRGFESYYAIPYGSETAQNGTWCKGPDIALFRAAKAELGKLPILAEDLGNITPAVRRLLKKTGFPGMKVLQFAFDSGADNPYLPHQYESPHCVVYTGTHDNHTLRGWVEAASSDTLKFAKRYLHVKKKRHLPDAILRAAWSSTAELSIAQMQDFLEADASCRMNLPATLGENWQYRTHTSDYTPQLQTRIRKLNQLYGRDAAAAQKGIKR